MVNLFDDDGGGGGGGGGGGKKTKKKNSANPLRIARSAVAVAAGRRAAFDALVADALAVRDAAAGRAAGLSLALARGERSLHGSSRQWDFSAARARLAEGPLRALREG